MVTNVGVWEAPDGVDAGPFHRSARLLPSVNLSARYGQHPQLTGTAGAVHQAHCRLLPHGCDVPSLCGPSDMHAVRAADPSMYPLALIR